MEGCGEKGIIPRVPDPWPFPPTWKDVNGSKRSDGSPHAGTSVGYEDPGTVPYGRATGELRRCRHWATVISNVRL
jgi:hypothetical protein